jgi:bacteriocin-like protein
MTQQETHKQSHHKKATNVAQDTNLSALEELNEEALSQITGGQQNMPTNTTGWTTVTQTSDRVKVSPDGKYYSNNGKVYENHKFSLS